jgi:hypothetical protein
MAISLRKFKVVLLLIAMASTCLVSIACKPQETDLSFETIEKLDWGGYPGQEPYSAVEPRIILVNNQQELEQLDSLVTPQARDELARLDFGEYFVIAVFRGLQGSSGFDTIIDRIVRRGNKIVVYTQFWERSPYYAYTAQETSPYHIVKVHRDSGIVQESELILQSVIVTPTPPSH